MKRIYPVQGVRKPIWKERAVFIFCCVFMALFPFDVQSNEPTCSTTQTDKLLGAGQAKFISITIPKSRKWNKNYFKAIKDPAKDILRKYKKKFDAKVGVLFDNDLKCLFTGKIRISGDHKDHIGGNDDRIRPPPPITSLDVQLLDGHIGSTIKFKLFIPRTKGNDNEVFSTALLKELGFLAPKTYYVPSTVNGQNFTFLFQEKIKKEFLESNNLREAPILEGDERFLFANDPFGFDRLGLARLANKNWSKKGRISLKISKVALGQLNKAYLEYLLGTHIYANRDPNFLPIKHINKDREFRAMMVAMGALHGLRPHNRKFYYDPIYKHLRPIYYDGNPTIVNLRNRHKLIRFGTDFNNDEIIGSKIAITSLNNVDRIDFKNKLKPLGLNYSLEKVQALLNDVELGLKLMGATPISKVLKNPYTPYFSNYVNLGKDSIEKKLAFSTKEDFRIEICDFLLTSCHVDTFNIDDYSKLLGGKYSDYRGRAYIFLGKKGEYISGTTRQKYWKVSRFKLGDGTELVSYGETRVLVDTENKKIILSQNNAGDRVLIKGGSLSTWHIKFIGVVDKKNHKEQRFDENLLTGCLTLLDMHVDNISINVEDSFCEDGVNLIRVSGNLNNVAIKNVMADAIDADFSKLSINSIRVDRAKNDCIDLSSGDYHIRQARLTECSDKAISSGEKSNLLIDFVQISKSNIGVAAKDSSSVKVGTIITNDIVTCFSAYRKKQEFWGGRMTVKKHNCQPSQVSKQQWSSVSFFSEF
jgi:hypothetical protein